MAEPTAPKPDRSAAEALRAAVQQTLEAAGRSARSGPAVTRERAGELLDEVVRRGRGARDELSRRGQEARGELARRLELLEGRLAQLEDALRRESRPEDED